MSKKLVIIAANINPHNSEVVGVPFFQATVAAAMEYEVELIFTGRSSQIAETHIAKQLTMGENKTVFDLFENAKEAGVHMMLCNTNPLKEPVDAITDIVGSAYIIQQVMADNVVVLSY